MVSEGLLLLAGLLLIWEFSFPHQVFASSYDQDALDFSLSSLDIERLDASGKLPAIEDRPVIVERRVHVLVSAYSSTPAETDRDPFTTASGTKVHDGVVAMNGIAFGTKIRIPDEFGDKVFVVEDRMHPRYSSRFLDLWMPTRDQAIEWGVRWTTVEIIG